MLSRSSGVLKPGEMCLVLGLPGSGCTTFLKAISNQREGYASISGDVRYAGMDAEEMARYYKGEVVYNSEGGYTLTMFDPIHPLTPVCIQMTFI
jgi:ABC-type multidrug transport system ATPase subunit